MMEKGVEKNYTCNMCHQSFLNIQNLRRYERSQHKNDAEQVACRLCDQTFAHKNNMERHIKSVHRDGVRMLTFKLLSEMS